MAYPCYNGPLYIWCISKCLSNVFIDRQHIEDLEFSDLVSKDLISVPKCHHQPIQDLTRCIASRHHFKITSWFETSCKTLIKRKRGYKLISFHNIKFSYVLFLIFYFKNINQAVLHFVINQDSIKYKQLKKACIDHIWELLSPLLANFIHKELPRDMTCYTWLSQKLKHF